MLRHVRMQTASGRTLELRTWDTGKTDWRGQTRIGYLFGYVDESAPLFEGTDFAGSPMHADDADETLASLLTFLTLRPGDTDADYFADYTPRQTEWTQDYDCESLACDVACFEEDARENYGRATPPWQDVCSCPLVWGGHGEPRPDPKRVDPDCPRHSRTDDEGDA